MDLASTCGQLVIGGFSGESLPASYREALQRGRRGGAILFASNVGGGLEQIAALAREVHAACPDPLLGIDQEGGRVARLHEPVLRVPPMATIASWGDVPFAERIARAVGAELTALGFTIDFAPVLDVNTCVHNPVIGDRAFGADPGVCAAFGAAWVRGLQAAGILATGKHFPGHGDTSKDSHLELPVVEQSRERIERVELAPFRAALSAGVAALMTAHVVYSAIDPDHPATLSRAICTGMRERIGFDGMLVSDDLEMQAIAKHGTIGDAAVHSVAAGCDALLVCHRHDAQDAAVDALVREAERSPSFRARCDQARVRVAAARRRAASHLRSDATGLGVIAGPASRAVADEIARRLEG